MGKSITQRSILGGKANLGGLEMVSVSPTVIAGPNEEMAPLL
jgi:hypothetical protein